MRFFILYRSRYVNIEAHDRSSFVDALLRMNAWIVDYLVNHFYINICISSCLGSMAFWCFSFQKGKWNCIGLEFGRWDINAMLFCLDVFYVVERRPKVSIVLPYKGRGGKKTMPRETEIRGSTLQKHVCNLPRAGFRSNICKITRPTTIPDNLSGLIPLLVSLSLSLFLVSKRRPVIACF